MMGLDGGFKTSTQNREIHYRPGNLVSNLFEITKNASSSFISQPILIVIALFGRVLELQHIKLVIIRILKFCSIILIMVI